MKEGVETCAMIKLKQAVEVRMKGAIPQHKPLYLSISNSVGKLKRATAAHPSTAESFYAQRYT